MSVARLHDRGGFALKTIRCNLRREAIDKALALTGGGNVWKAQNGILFFHTPRDEKYATVDYN